MTQPNDGTTGNNTPDPTQAIPTPQQGGYSYPGQAAASGGVPLAGVPLASNQASNQATGPASTLTEDPAPKSGKRTGLLVGGLAAALVLGGGAVFAATQLSGGGAQPADVLPGDSYAYFRLDIDPSAGQKIAAVRFLNKLPDVKKTFGEGDMRKNIWGEISKGNDCLSQLDYDKDVAPWLGDRVGMSMRPGGTEQTPNMAVAIQVSDEGKAKDTITKMLACDGDSATELNLKGGYAILTPKGQGAETLAAIDKGNLAANATFSGDMAALGEQGVASMWVDGPGFVKEVSNFSGDVPEEAKQMKGRVTAALRFDPSYVELAGMVRGVDQLKKVDGSGAELANLPDDTLGALHASGIGDLAVNNWPSISKLIEEQSAKDGSSNPIPEIEQQLGVKLPDDLKVLFGQSITIALPNQDFQSDIPTFGAKIVSPDAAKADAVLTKLEQSTNGQLTLNKKVAGNKVIMSTTPDYTAKLEAGGKLGDTEGFKAALGDVSKTTYALYVDLDKLEPLLANQIGGGQSGEVLKSLKAIGLNVSTVNDGEATFSLRVVGD